MIPSAGARTAARARRACASASCAAATLTLAAAVNPADLRRCVSSADKAPEAPTACARRYSASARSASARACSSAASRFATCGSSTETFKRASTWPRFTWSPASTYIAAMRPASPSTPMGMSYRAAMVPMMLTVVGTLLTPTSVTDTVGIGTLVGNILHPPTPE